jgi:hypothetical protein
MPPERRHRTKLGLEVRYRPDAVIRVAATPACCHRNPQIWSLIFLRHYCEAKQAVTNGSCINDLLEAARPVDFTE